MRLKTPLKCYSNTDLVYIFSILVLNNTKVDLQQKVRRTVTLSQGLARQNQQVS